MLAPSSGGAFEKYVNFRSGTIYREKTTLFKPRPNCLYYAILGSIITETAIMQNHIRL